MERTPLSSWTLHRLTRGLADALVVGPWDEEDLVTRAARALGRRGRWLRPLARRLVAEFGSGPRPRAARVAAFLRADAGLLRAWDRTQLALVVDRPPRPVMAPAPGPPTTWAVPILTTPAAVAEFLGLTPADLSWFADAQARERRTPPGPLRHYDYRWQAKRSGSARLIEAPRPRLKALQRRLLDQLVAAIPPHDAAHGYRRGRSIGSFVAPHAGREVVVKLDLRDFFPTITAARVTALFLTAGYPEPVARVLAGLCTNSVPGEVWDQPGGPGTGPDTWRLRRLYQQPHLPQGAPTSPALANLAAYRLDCRLNGLARAVDAAYTRYADDLIFSGDASVRRAVERLVVHVGAIALEEGFAVQYRKTRVMRAGVRQQAAGLVLNVRPNVPRKEYDTLKAILTNCIRHGPRDQNRSGHPDFAAHLAGRIAHVAAIHPSHGQRLRRLFDQIAWPASVHREPEAGFGPHLA